MGGGFEGDGEAWRERERGVRNCKELVGKSSWRGLWSNPGESASDRGTGWSPASGSGTHPTGAANCSQPPSHFSLCFFFENPQQNRLRWHRCQVLTPVFGAAALGRRDMNDHLSTRNRFLQKKAGSLDLRPLRVDSLTFGPNTADAKGVRQTTLQVLPLVTVHCFARQRGGGGPYWNI